MLVPLGSDCVHFGHPTSRCYYSKQKFIEPNKDNKFSRLSERERSKESMLQAPKRGKHTIQDQKSAFHNKRSSLMSEISNKVAASSGASRRSSKFKTLEMEKQMIVMD